MTSRSAVRLLIPVCVLLAACAPAVNANPTLPPSSTDFTVVPRFVDYYLAHGGRDTLGDPISPERQEGRLIDQYFQNGRLEYNSAAAPGSQVSLSALGREFTTPDPPNVQSPEPDSICFAETGHCVSAFRPYFEKYGGVNFFGFPLTDIKLDGGRLVQHFEGAMLVWDESLPAGLRIQLSPLGLLKCSLVNCAVQPSDAIQVLPSLDLTPTLAPIKLAITHFVARHGGRRVFGDPLSEPQPGPDGAVEQYFENAVVYVDLAAPDEVMMRPLGLAHHPLDPAAAPVADPTGLYDPTTGHNVLYGFRVFYDEYGGPPLVGRPISELQVEGGLLVQYFENGRLEWHSGSAAGQEVRLSPFGREALTGLSPASTPEAAGPPQTLAIKAWSDLPVLTIGQAQTIGVRAVDGLGNPVAGVAVRITVHDAGGAVDYAAPATDADGQTSVTFLLREWRAGEFVPYEVNATYGQLAAQPIRDQFIQWYGPAPTSTPG